MGDRVNVNFEYYRIFYYVAKYRSISQAARALQSSQPNVSRAIKLLEEGLGHTVFIRSSKGVFLTEAGEKLFSHISRAVEEIQAGEEEIMGGGKLEGGSLAVSVTETSLHELLLAVLDKFHTRFPKVKILLSNHTTHQALSAIRSKAVELAVVTTPMELSPPLRQTPVKIFRDVLVCGREYRHLVDEKMRLIEICQYPLISLGKHTMSYQHYRAIFLQNNVKFSPDMEASTTGQILAMVKNNLGLAFLSESLVCAAIENGEVFRVELAEEIPERSVCLVENTDQPLSTIGKELKKLILEHQNTQ